VKSVKIAPNRANNVRGKLAECGCVRGRRSACCERPWRKALVPGALVLLIGVLVGLRDIAARYALSFARAGAPTSWCTLSCGLVER